MNIEEIKRLFIQLEEHLRKYGNSSILSSYKLVRSTIKFLESNESDEDKKRLLFIAIIYYIPIKDDYQNSVFGIMTTIREWH